MADERKPIMVEVVEKEITFINFPAFLDRGETVYRGMDLKVCDEIARGIPNDLRKAVIVDFSKVNTERYVEKYHNRIGYIEPTEEQKAEMRADEEKLLQVMKDCGLFSKDENETNN